MGRWLRLSESWESCWVEVEVNRCGEWARRGAASGRKPIPSLRYGITSRAGISGCTWGDSQRTVGWGNLN